MGKDLKKRIEDNQEKQEFLTRVEKDIDSSCHFIFFKKPKMNIIMKIIECAWVKGVYEGLKVSEQFLRENLKQKNVKP